jgi:hypothetical protein
MDMLEKGHKDNLVTDEEFNQMAVDVPANQKQAWLKEQTDEWTTAINDRREVRSEEGSNSGQTSIV